MVLAAVLCIGTHSSAMHRGVSADVFAPLTAPLITGAHVTVHDLSITDRESVSVDLELFDVWAPDGKIVLYTDHGIIVLKPPRIHTFRGHIIGRPDSLVFISQSDEGMRGFVLRDGERFAIHARRTSSPEDSDVVINLMRDAPEDLAWECAVDNLQTHDLRTSPLRVKKSDSLSSGTATYVLRIAVDTDHALYTNLGSNSVTVQNYVTNLVAAASTVYHRDLQTDLKLVYTGIYSATKPDPFTMLAGTPGTPYQTSLDALVELGKVWQTASLTPGDERNINRSAVMLLSGSAQRSGNAWIQTVCTDDFAFPTTNVTGGYGGAYGYVGGVGIDGTTVPDPTANSPTYVTTTTPSDPNYWTLLEFAHELGHIVQSPHTHCVALSAQDAQPPPAGYGRATVDQCFSGEPGDNCYMNGSHGAVDANVPTEKGTIMSYCHKTTGAGTATRYVFGKSGEASHKVVDDMKAALSTATPVLSTFIGVPSSVPSGCASTISVANQTGVSYLWEITNGTITSGQGTNAISFTGSANPVTVTVTETITTPNTHGCGAKDSVSIPFGLGVPQNVVATAGTSTSVPVSWTSSGCSYEVWRSSKTSATTFSLLGSPTLNSYTDVSAEANAAYLYKVRALPNGGGSASNFSAVDLATTVIFTNDPLVVRSTVVKFAHINELRTAVSAVRALAGLGAYSFTDATLTTGTKIKAVHITDLRTALDAARSTLLLSALAYTDPTLTVHATSVKAAHLQELRTGVK